MTAAKPIHADATVIAFDAPPGPCPTCGAHVDPLRVALALRDTGAYCDRCAEDATDAATVWLVGALEALAGAVAAADPAKRPALIGNALNVIERLSTCWLHINNQGAP